MDSDANADRLSNLPKNVTQAILMCLPIREAARTSVLARAWRYKWSTIPQIVIKEKSVLSKACRDRWIVHLDNGETKKSLTSQKYLLQREFDCKVVKIVDHILLLHHGPIDYFKISTQMETSAHFDRWILFLSRNGIKKLTLDKWKGEVYKLPSSLFSCVDLTCLELFRCTFAPSPSFKGFSGLTVLNLQSITITEECLHLLLSASQCLEELLLRYITGCTHLEITAPKLLDLNIYGEFEDVQIKSVPLLKSVSIKLGFSDDSDRADCRIGQILGHIPSIEELDLLGSTLQNLAVGDIPVCLPERCPAKDMIIHMNFENMQEMLAAFCIFRSCPIIEKLEIKAISNKDNARISVDGFWEGEENFHCTFSHLHTVKVTVFSGIPSELKFIEFILGNAPVLEKLHIEFENEESNEEESDEEDDKEKSNVLKIFRELIRFRRISPKAELFVPA